MAFSILMEHQSTVKKVKNWFFALYIVPMHGLTMVGTFFMSETSRGQGGLKVGQRLS